MSKVLAAQPKGIHIVLDNLSAHSTQAMKEFLEQNPRVHFHFTPTYLSGLNQVEIRFANVVVSWFLGSRGGDLTSSPGHGKVPWVQY